MCTLELRDPNYPQKVAGEHRKPVELVLMFEDGELEMAQGKRELGRICCHASLHDRCTTTRFLVFEVKNEPRRRPKATFIAESS